jgi:hypothetical protein
VSKVRSSSYQRLIAAWKLGAPIALLAISGIARADPYEDTKHRFVFDLPAGWRLAPRFGDLYGMSFERAIETDVAVLTVHADPAPGSDLRSFADAVEAEWSRAEAAERSSESKRKIAGQSAIVREYAIKKRGRRARSYLFSAAGRFYHVRVDAPGAALRGLEPEIDGLLASFRPMKPPAEAEEEEEEEEELDLSGTWIGKGGVRLVLTDEGGFSLGERSGRYKLEGRTLILSVTGKPPQRFEIQLQDRGAALALSSPNLPQPAIYRRGDSAPEASDRFIMGHWTTETARGSVVLILSSDGVFEMAPLAGRWSVKGDRLTLRGGQGESVVYRFRLEGSTLVLSGGDLDAPLKFHRNASE